MYKIRMTVDETQMVQLIAFCTSKKIGCEVEAPSYLGQMSTEFMPASETLKNFCGSEMQNRDGKLQPSAVLEFILQYTRRNNLVTGVTIRLDDVLSHLFDTSGSIQYLDLPRHVNMLFQNVSNDQSPSEDNTQSP